MQCWRGSGPASAASSPTDGVGTTLLAAASNVPLEPRFGVDSAQWHRATGAVPLEADLGLRWDIDTPADLVAALAAVPVGDFTRGALVP